MNKAFVRFVATFGYVGLLPIAPGTWGSFAGALICIIAPGTLPLFLILFTVLGYLVAADAENIFEKKVPGAFVIDEVSGMMLTVLGLPSTLPVVLAGFFLFRLFDIWKPWPINIIQRMDSPFVIVHDDLLAGVYANVVLRVGLRFLGVVI